MRYTAILKWCGFEQRMEMQGAPQTWIDLYLPVGETSLLDTNARSTITPRLMFHLVHLDQQTNTATYECKTEVVDKAAFYRKNEDYVNTYRRWLDHEVTISALQSIAKRSAPVRRALKKVGAR